MSNARYTENGRINVYVGSDSKLHFVNRDGADTALNFSNNNYIVDSFSTSATDTNHYQARFDFGKYFTSYDEFLKHSIVALCGSGAQDPDNVAKTDFSGYMVYNGEAHQSGVSRVAVEGTTVRVWHYQVRQVADICNFVLIFK